MIQYNYQQLQKQKQGDFMENIRIQDDLYMFVNQETLDKLVIPDDKPTAGGFQELADGVEKIMMGEFETMAESKNYPNDYLKRACELYAIAKVLGVEIAELFDREMIEEYDRG
jgi:predicted metalloendopeptidase